MPATTAHPYEEGDPGDSDLVDWFGDNDPEKPVNWPYQTKLLQTLTWAAVGFPSLFASSAYSPVIATVQQEFGMSYEVATLGTSLFLLGNGFGPPVWGPLSEKMGRKVPAVLSMLGMSIFTLGVASAKDIQTIMICRFFAGVFAIGPTCVTGGAMADMWDAGQRGVAMSFVLSVTLFGIPLAPVIGSYVVASPLGWRWTMWFTAILSFTIVGLAYYAIQESFPPTLLSRRAAHIRHQSKQWAVRAKVDEEEVDLHKITTEYLVKPAVLLATKPKLAFLTAYSALIWGLLFFFFSVFPIAFGEVRGWSATTATLPFLSELAGALIATAILIINSIMQAKRGSTDRLPTLIFGGFCLPIGLFWFAWTSMPDLNCAAQIVSIAVIGISLVIIQTQVSNYIVDTYTDEANSAMAANTTVRALFGAGFPMIAKPFYHGLGVPWATSTIGFVCLAMAPVPVLFAWRERRREENKESEPLLGNE